MICSSFGEDHKIADLDNSLAPLPLIALQERANHFLHRQLDPLQTENISPDG